jgi:hypothetical protein
MLSSNPRAAATRCRVVSVAPTPPASTRATAAWLVPIRTGKSRWLKPAVSRAARMRPPPPTRGAVTEGRASPAGVLATVFLAAMGPWFVSPGSCSAVTLHGQPDRDKLGGPCVAVDLGQTFVGGRSGMGKGGPRYFSNTEVAIAVERLHPKRASGEHVCAGSPRRPGRTRSMPSPRTASPAPGSIVYTDGDRPLQRPLE